MSRPFYALVSRRSYSTFFRLSLLLLAICGLRSYGVGQFDDQAAHAIAGLSPTSQKVLGVLSKLSELPADDWRYHAGNVEHGEAVELDDSNWQIVKAGAEATSDAVWYRRWIEVPKNLSGYDLTGTKIWLRFMAYANDPLPEVFYFNGRRVAMGEDLEPIVLFDAAKPGDKVLVAVKLLHTIDKKVFRGVRLQIDFDPHRPNPGDLRTEFLSDAVLIPSLSRSVDGDKATLEKAVAAVDLAALDKGDQSGFDASLERAESNLQPLRPVMRPASFHMTGNSHIDAAWLWPWSETVDVVKRTFGTALQLMNEYPDYTYTQSAAAYNNWMAEKYPEMNAEIKRRIKEGRWEIVGGMWVEPDLNMPDGESLVRQLLIGKRYYKREYGVDVRIGWNPDSFGYNWQLPQIYKKSGVDYFATQKMTWNDTNKLPFKLFWWESPDGSKVLAYFPHDYANDNLNPLRLSEDLAKAREFSPGMLQMMDLYGIGDHGGGPTRAILDEGTHWMGRDKALPAMHFGTAQTYFTEIEAKVASDSPVWNYDSIAKNGAQLPFPPAGELSIPTWKDELYFEYHRGVLTSQAEHKASMRRSEESLLDAEKYSSLAWLAGGSYPGAELSEAWKKTLFNQFHDLAAGSGIGVIYKDAQQDYRDVQWATNEVSSQAIKALSAEINTRAAGPVPLLVFNPLSWERDGLVTAEVQMPEAAGKEVSVLDAAGQVQPSQTISHDAKTDTYRLLVQARRVPSLGYKVLRVVPGSRPFPSDLKASGLTLENNLLRVSIDPQSGCITSLYDKKSHFETLAANGCGNELIAFKDTPQRWDAWNIDADFGKVFTLLDGADSVELIEKGPLRATIRVVRTWQSSKFVQDITLYAGCDQVDVQNDIDWHETHVLLKAAFPLAASSNKATYEIPFGTIERPTTRNNSWEQAKFEVPALRWADLGDKEHGFSLINESKYGYDTRDNVLRLSLLRSPVWPDPDADRGHHHFGYALYPHAGTWKDALTVRHGYEYNYKLLAQQVSPHSGLLPPERSYLTVKPQNVVLTAMKKAEDSDSLIFRLYEWAGSDADVHMTLPEGSTKAVETNLMEQPEGSPLQLTAGKINVPIHPYEILTVRVDFGRKSSAVTK